MSSPQVVLITHTVDPIQTLWLAYRTCYSEKVPQELLWNQPSRTEMIRFVERRLQTEHTSPLEHVNYTFAISGVSRSFSHQFVRHRVGMSVSQQSQRYVKVDNLHSGMVLPPVPTEEQTIMFEDAYAAAKWHYDQLLSAGVPAEDARFVLPQATATNLFVTINLAALQHMADIRLCTLTQWEFRKVVALMRAEVKRIHPDIAKHLGPKCMAGRRGSCDEDYKSYEGCPLSAVRPHRNDSSAKPDNHEIVEAHLDEEAAFAS